MRSPSTLVFAAVKTDGRYQITDGNDELVASVSVNFRRTHFEATLPSGERLVEGRKRTGLTRPKFEVIRPDGGVAATAKPFTQPAYTASIEWTDGRRVWVLIWLGEGRWVLAEEGTTIAEATPSGPRPTAAGGWTLAGIGKEGSRVIDLADIVGAAEIVRLIRLSSQYGGKSFYTSPAEDSNEDSPQ
jgi:hypothetical protein